jgi:hypothetical protein
VRFPRTLRDARRTFFSATKLAIVIPPRALRGPREGFLFYPNRLVSAGTVVRFSFWGTGQEQRRLVSVEERGSVSDASPRVDPSGCRGTDSTSIGFCTCVRFLRLDQPNPGERGRSGRAIVQSKRVRKSPFRKGSSGAPPLFCSITVVSPSRRSENEQSRHTELRSTVPGI